MEWRARAERRNNDYEMRKELLQRVRLVHRPQRGFCLYVVGDLTSRPQITKRFLAALWMYALRTGGRAETPRRKE